MFAFAIALHAKSMCLPTNMSDMKYMLFVRLEIGEAFACVPKNEFFESQTIIHIRSEHAGGEEKFKENALLFRVIFLCASKQLRLFRLRKLSELQFSTWLFACCQHYHNVWLEQTELLQVHSGRTWYCSIDNIACCLHFSQTGDNEWYYSSWSWY